MRSAEKVAAALLQRGAEVDVLSNVAYNVVPWQQEPLPHNPWMPKNYLSEIEYNEQLQQAEDELNNHCIYGDREYNALHHAVNTGGADLVELILQNGGKVGSKSGLGNTALILATFLHHEQIVEMLLENGANIRDTNTYRQTVLYWACTIGSEPIVRQLLRYDAPLDIFSLDEDYTPLHIAAMGGKERIVTMLIESGAHIDAKSSNPGFEVTPLYIAIARNDINLVQLLL